MNATEPIDTKAPLVLIVDDDADARTLHGELLRRRGFLTAEAESAEDGMEMAVACAADVILMDASMPGISGFEAARRLKGAPLTHAIPIVMLTGFTHVRDASGCDAFLAKPSTPDDIAAALRSVLGAAHRTDER